MQCAQHPSTETELACSKCETPICSKCLVRTPVGARCPTCANVHKLPIYNISAGVLVRAGGAALFAGAVLGAVWGALLPFTLSFFFGLAIGFGVGYSAGEAVSIAANRKVGPPLQVLAGAAVVIAYLVRSAILASEFRNVALLDIVTSDILGYISVAVGIFVAAGRVR